jgi:hypothetical protein
LYFRLDKQAEGMTAKQWLFTADPALKSVLSKEALQWRRNATTLHQVFTLRKKKKRERERGRERDRESKKERVGEREKEREGEGEREKERKRERERERERKREREREREGEKKERQDTKKAAVPRTNFFSKRFEIENCSDGRLIVLEDRRGECQLFRERTLSVKDKVHPRNGNDLAPTRQTRYRAESFTLRPS